MRETDVAGDADTRLGRLRRVVSASRTAGAVGRTAAGFDRAVSHSATVSVAGRWLQGSRLYQWMDAPPEEDRVVIDVQDSLFARPFVSVLVAAREACRLAWEHALVAPYLAELRWNLYNRPGRLLGGVLAVWVFVEYGLFFYPGASSTFGSLGRGALIALALFFLRLRLPDGTVSRSHTARVLRAILVPPDYEEDG